MRIMLSLLLWELSKLLDDAEVEDRAACGSKQIPVLAAVNQRIQLASQAGYQYWKIKLYF